MKKGLILGLMVIITMVAVYPVYAISFDFTTDHCTGGCGAVPFGTVTLLQNGTTVDVTVHLLNGNQFVLTGAADFQDFKFNATGVSLGDITVDSPVPAIPYTLVATTGAFTGNGTGSFAFGITGRPDQHNGASYAFSSDIVFHVAMATIGDLTAPNSLGYIFVADILSTNGNTGPVAAGTPVPEPGTILLLGTGIIGLWGFRRKIKK